MSAGIFFLGVIIMVVGFTMVWRTNLWQQFFGNLEYAIGVSWITWKTLGIAMMFFGFMLAFGLLGLFWNQTIGSSLNFGQSFRQ